MTERDFLEWLEEQDGSKVRRDVVEEKFDLRFDLGTVTCTLDDEGNTLVPKRDYRQAIKYGQVFD